MITDDLTVRQLMEETDIAEGSGPEDQTFSATPESETATAIPMDEMDNLRLAHELQMNPGQFNLPGLPTRGPQRSVSDPLTGGPVDAAAHAELVSQIELQARRAFWGIMIEQLSAEPAPDYEMLLGLLEEAFGMLRSLAPTSASWVALSDRCDMTLLRQQAE